MSSEYKVGDKFVIEIEEVFINDSDDFLDEKELYRIKGFNSLVFDKNGLDKLTMAITPEEDGLVTAEKVEEAYSKGLQDAWELAKKIVLKSEKGGFRYDDMYRIFGISDYASVLENMSPQEALAKIEAYESEQEIKVGDVIDHQGLKSVVVAIAPDKIYCVTRLGTTPSYYEDDFLRLKKTGKHIDIESILEQIGGGKDE